MLNEEETSDRQLREQFRERWTRTPSQTLTAPIRSEAQKYRTIINNAMSADKVVKQRFNEHRSGYELLSKTNVSVCHVNHAPSICFFSFAYPFPDLPYIFHTSADLQLFVPLSRHCCPYTSTIQFIIVIMFIKYSVGPMVQCLNHKFTTLFRHAVRFFARAVH